MAALSGALEFIVRLLQHPVVQTALKKALLAAGREVIRHAVSTRSSERVNKTRVNRA